MPLPSLPYDNLRKPGKEALINWASPLSRSLVGAFLFANRNDLTSPNLVSTSVATLNNTTAAAGWAATRFGYGPNFDGVDDLITTSEAALVLTSNFTWLTWINLSTLTAIGTEPINFITTGYFIFCGQTFTSFGRQGVAHDVQTTSPLSTGDWHQIAATVDASFNVVLYIDGRAAASGTTTSTAPAAPLQFSHSTYLITGQTDHVNIWNRALLPSEVASLFRDPFSIYVRSARPMSQRRKEIIRITAAATTRRNRRLLLGVGS